MAEQLYQCRIPQGSAFGVSSGVGGGHHRGRPAFTGKAPNGLLYWRGYLWVGPTNLIGHNPVKVRINDTTSGFTSQ